MKYLVFTYGTLMKGQSAYGRFGDCEYVCDATLFDYAIYEVGSYPAAVPLEGFKVEGEVYAVDEKLLERFDEYEEVGEIYDRKLVKVITADKKTLEAFFYEYILDVRDLELRKPEGKWSPIRNPMYV